MSYFRSAVMGCLLFGLAVNPVSALEISVIDRAAMKPFQQEEPSEAYAALADHTVSMRSWEQSGFVARALPIANASILYFSPDGQVLGWSAKSDIVEVGEWKIEPENDRLNNLCLKFANNPNANTCQALHITRPVFFEITDGNPFGLNAGDAVPYRIEIEDAVISVIAEKLGL